MLIHPLCVVWHWQFRGNMWLQHVAVAWLGVCNLGLASVIVALVLALMVVVLALILVALLTSLAAGLLLLLLQPQGAPIKTPPPRKTSVFQQWYYEFEPNSGNLYASIHVSIPQISLKQLIW